MAGGGAKHGSKKKGIELDDVRNEINVTPLVDVCLVLLIIMMVIGPLLARGKEVPLPATEFHTDGNDNHEPIVAVDSYGRMYVDKDEVKTVAELQDKIQRDWQALRASNAKLGGDVDRSGESRVLVKVSPEVEYGKVYPIIMAIHDMGASGIDLGTQERKE